MLERGDIAKLKEPFEADHNQTITHGVVAEIVTTFPTIEVKTDRYSTYSNKKILNNFPRISLLLFNPSTREIHLESAMGASGIHTFVDFHISELILIQKRDEMYNPRDLDFSTILTSYAEAGGE